LPVEEVVVVTLQVIKVVVEAVLAGIYRTHKV
jgi:hypothetical protein